MKSTYHLTSSKTDWKQVEWQCTAATVFITFCMVISCIALTVEMKNANIVITTPINKLWELSSFRVLTAFTLLLMPFLTTAGVSVYLQRKNPNNE